MISINKVVMKGAMAFFIGYRGSVSANSCDISTAGLDSSELIYWTDKNPSPSPPIRFSPCFTYDPPSGKIILFGGVSGYLGTFYNDTWSYDATTNTWTQLFPTVSPSARDSARLNYDPATDKLILFGGNGPTGYLGDTWTYDSATNTWTDVTPPGSPPARNGSVMAYDFASGRMLLFGGYGNILADYDDTWAYDAVANVWTQITPVGSPPARDSAAMTFDVPSHQMILFGGYSNNTGGNLLNDTWACTYDAGTQIYTWTQLFPSTSPSARYGSGLRFDACISALVLFGGGYLSHTSNDTWTYNGVTNTWTELSPLNPPAPREFAGLSPNPPTGQIILYGGVDIPSNTVRPDTQALTFAFSPTFTSSNEAAFNTGSYSSFTITTSGFPDPAITLAGTLPEFLTFVDNQDGTATISGILNPNTVGSYQLTFTANNGINPPATQIFTLNVGVPPPTSFVGKVVENRFINQTNFEYKLFWTAPVNTAGIVSYQISRNGVVIATVPATAPFVYIDKVQCKRKRETYMIVSVNAYGDKSTPLSVVL